MHSPQKHPTSPNKLKFSKPKYMKKKTNDNPVITAKSGVSLHLQKAQISLFKPNKMSSLFIETVITQQDLRAKYEKPGLPRISFSLNRMKRSEKIKIQNSYPSLSLTTNSWCLYDSKIDKYYGFRQQYQRQVASLTKIMTTYLSIQIIQRYQISLKCKLRITKTASSLGGTSANLDYGHWISIQDLLYAIMLPSGNDAAYCLAEYIGFFLCQLYREKKTPAQLSYINQMDLIDSNTNIYVQQFISSMNQRSLGLGLYRTRFSNPHGLQNALNISSAKDIIVLSQYAAKNELFSKIMKTTYYMCKVFLEPSKKASHSKIWLNSNKLLQKGWEGVKTGHTISAGGCLCSLKQGIFISVLNSQNAATRFTDTEKIFDWYKDRESGPKKREIKLYLDSPIFVKQRLLSQSCF